MSKIDPSIEGSNNESIAISWQILELSGASHNIGDVFPFMEAKSLIIEKTHDLLSECVSQDPSDVDIRKTDRSEEIIRKSADFLEIISDKQSQCNHPSKDRM